MYSTSILQVGPQELYTHYAFAILVTEQLAVPTSSYQSCQIIVSTYCITVQRVVCETTVDTN